jgi:hypothetical protein
MSKSARRKSVVLGLAALVLSGIGGGSLFLSPTAAQSCGYGYGGYGCPGEPASIELSPPSATSQVGTQHCVEATVRDAVGAPVENVNVRFSVAGTSDGALKTTGTDGKATFCYSGPTSPRDDTITATVEGTATANGPYLENPPSCPAAGLGYTFAFRYENGEALSVSPVVGCNGSAGTDSATSPGGQRQDVTVSQTSTTGATVIHISTSLTRPGAPQTNASPTLGLDVGLPAGMARNSGKFPTCTKARLQQFGPAGCPRDARVGTGTATLDVRPVITDPVHAVVSIFNGENGHLLLFSLSEIGPTFITEGAPNANGVLVFNLPPILTLPGRPDATITALDLSVGATGSGGGGNSGVGASNPTTPGTGAGTTTVPGSTVAAPRAVLSGPRTQKFNGAITVSAECTQACTVLGAGSVSVPKASKLKSKRVKRNLAAGQRVKLKLTFPKKAARAIRRALRHKRVTATVSVTTRGVGANAAGSSTTKRKITLRR